LRLPGAVAVFTTIPAASPNVELPEDWGDDDLARLDVNNMALFPSFNHDCSVGQSDAVKYVAGVSLGPFIPLKGLKAALKLGLIIRSVELPELPRLDHE